ncbi:hypothetical protein DERP_000083 [Dermatophagoides pteronyssinus]|uniref:Uncharacterized protein n=1 Tax=Dermatophagoides pteronyssinus TaxID=6956 RepID=A0ABQ8IZ58_DERPT|nr:hypothetical protein DERP_000083 [Dermatophagoides pteronyssinus]
MSKISDLQQLKFNIFDCYFLRPSLDVFHHFSMIINSLGSNKSIGSRIILIKSILERARPFSWLNVYLHEKGTK